MKSNDNPIKAYMMPLDLCIDEEELNNFFIIDEKDIDLIECIEEDIENDYIQTEDVGVEENCMNCFFSQDGYCSCKAIYVNQSSPICWFYRDSLTMRAASDFQDDNDDFKEFD